MKKANPSLNHTAAHILATAILKLYPDAILGFGPAIDEGFYYDFKFKEAISNKDLPRIEKEMKKIIAGGYKVIETTKQSFLNQPLKEELLEELRSKNEKITYYGFVNPSNSEIIFSDVCQGGHIESTSKVKNFKLLSLAGAYWKGDSKNEQLTRIYGTAWETQEELEEYLALIEDRKQRDHRKIGKEMKIFTFEYLAGQGFPIWLEDGVVIKNEIQKFIRDLEKKYGFHEVITPAFGAKKLYEISGHLAHYSEDMFPIIQVDNEELIMRPMTCPHHFLIYSGSRRSYRELPLRISEHSKLYRYEKSGALTGLERVRSMELTDAHIFCRQDQIVEEFKNAYKLINEVLTRFKIQIDYVSLSLRDKEDKEKYFDDDKMWEDAENGLRKVLKELDIEYEEKIGEAAFYGPKIDIQVKTALGHEITLSTLQLDFLLPSRFEAYYIDENQEKKPPVLIHRGLIGTYERFISILLEQTKGVLPFWLAPRHVTIIPVSESHLEYANEIYDILIKQNIRVHLDSRNERVGKKIRDAQMSKTKFQFVLGDEEMSSKTINVRAYGSDKQTIIKIEDFFKLIEKE